MDVPPIRSRRLELVSLSPQVLEALLDGRRGDAEAELSLPLPADWLDDALAAFLRMRLGQMQRDPGSQPWLVHGVVRRRDRRIIGHAGFHGPPGSWGIGPDRVELGYTILAPYRGQGFGTEAAEALMSWAGSQGIRHFVASVSPENQPSLAIVRKLGFVQTGEQWDDEDGLELVFELDRSAR